MAEKPHRIAIIGGGAVGLTYAAFLAKTAQVLIKTRRADQAARLRGEGISLTLDGLQEQISGIDASADIASLADCDAVLITVKSYDTETVAQEISDALRPDAEVVSLQNGLEAFGVLRTSLKHPERVFAGVTYIGARRTDDRSVTLGSNRRTILDSDAAQLAAALSLTKYGVESSSDIRQAVWDKMVLNTGQNALSAVTGLTLGEMLASQDCLDVAAKLLAEFEQVAIAEGLGFDYSLLDKLKDNWQMSNFRPSMWQDLRRGHRTEIDAINGTISQLGAQHGLSTPCNDMIVSLVKALESASLPQAVV